MADYIPFEIQAEIMKRLPTKSLMQFRSVSKQWKSLIDSSEFIGDYSFNHTHQQHLLVSYLQSLFSEEKYVLIVGDDTFPQTRFSLPAPIPAPTPAPTPQCGRLMILGSSHGLFCLYRFTRVPSENVIMIKRVVVWNPSVRKSVAIDVPDIIEHGSYFDIGFGVCPHTRDPKLVKIKYRYNLKTLIVTSWQFDVYTLSSRAWRSIPAINQFRQSIKLKRLQVVIDGFIHRLASDLTNSQKLIVSFDITNEKFMEISLPNTLAYYRNHIDISKLKESLVVVEMVKESEKLVYGVWRMESGVSNTFTKLFTINSPEASLQGGFHGFWKNNEPIFQMRSVDSDTDDLVVSEVNSKHNKYTRISWKGVWFSASPYMETLLLLDY